MQKGILIVSFGTTYPQTRQKNIAAITRAVRALYPDALVETAVSSAVVRAAMKAREGLTAKSPEEGLLYLKEQGVTHAIVFPTHVIDGIENHRMKEAAEAHRGSFAAFSVAKPLLAEEKDYTDTARALWESLKDEVGASPLVLMGHGTEHAADESYRTMERALREYSGHAVYLATVEGSVTIGDVIAQMKADGVAPGTRVVVTPFMLVAGDHANNDMAGEQSFASALRENGYAPECIIRGLGEYPAVRELYLAHLRAAAHIFTGAGAPRPGRLYCIGVGPGDPGLMTLRAIETIRACDLLVLPATSPEECRAYHIAKQALPEVASMPLLCMPFPMIRDEKKVELAHARIYAAIEEELRRGRTVGMLTLGDPTVYSTSLYMHERARAAGQQSTLVSGVPSFAAVAARLGLSLGERAQEIHIIPASCERLEETLSLRGTRIYLKSGRKLKELLTLLRARESELSVCGVTNCGMEGERMYRSIDELETAEGYLTTVIVKEKR